jgi:hypothetical protein
MNDTPPQLPVDELRGAAEDAASHADIDALHAELSSEKPSPERIAEHVEGFRDRPKIFAVVANWFDDPRTQTFLADLAGTGL